MENYKLIERPKSFVTKNPAIKAITESKTSYTYVPALPATNTNNANINDMISAVTQLDDIGITAYMDPIIRKAYPMEFDKLYITTDPDKALVIHTKDTVNIDLELDADLDLANWYDSGMFDLYIPDSPLYKIGRIIDIPNGIDVCAITINDGPILAYYIYNKNSLVVGNWLYDNDYINVIVRKVWPQLIEKLYLKET